MSAQTKEQRAYTRAVHQLAGFNAVFGTRALAEFATHVEGAARQRAWGWPVGDPDERMFFEMTKEFAERAHGRFRNVSEVIADSIDQLMRAYDGRSAELDPLVLVDLRILERVLMRAHRLFEAEFISNALAALEEVAEDD